MPKPSNPEARHTSLRFPHHLLPCVDYNRCPISAAWNAISPTGRPTRKWHVVTFYRYSKCGLTEFNGRPNAARIYKKTQHNGITRATVAAAALKIYPLPQLRKGYTWAQHPLITDFVVGQLLTGSDTERDSKLPSLFLATNSGAL